MGERSMPFDPEAEESVLATALLPDGWPLLGELAGTVAPGDFFREKHGWIWSAVLDLWRRGEEPNQVTVASELARRDRLEDAGGQTFLADIVRNLSTPLGGPWYAGIVKADSKRRRIIHEAHRTMEAAYTDDPDSLADNAAERFIRLGLGREKVMTRSAAEILDGSKSPDGVGVVEQIETFLTEPNVIRGISTGWSALDEIIGGLRKTRLYTILGDTSVGKSWFVHFLAWSIAKQGKPVLIATTEMSGDEVIERIVFMAAGLDALTATGTSGDRKRISDAQGQVAELPLFVCDVGRIALSTLHAEARRQQASHGLDVLFVDHIQHVTVPGLKGAQLLEDVMAGEKGIAMNLDIPVVQVSHVNRDAAKWGLGLHSGKGSGSIEQDSNVVLTLEPVSIIDGQWQPMSEGEADFVRQRDNRIAVRVKSNKNRGGQRGYDVRHLDFGLGGRFTALARDA